MGNQATGSIDSWGPVGISLTLLQEVVGVVQSIGVSCGVRVVQSVALESIFVGLSVTLLQKVVGVVQSVLVACGIGVVQSVTLDSILIGLGSQVLSSSSLL